MFFLLCNIWMNVEAFICTLDVWDITTGQWNHTLKHKINQIPQSPIISCLFDRVDAKTKEVNQTLTHIYTQWTPPSITPAVIDTLLHNPLYMRPFKGRPPQQNQGFYYRCVYIKNGSAGGTTCCSCQKTRKHLFDPLMLYSLWNTFFIIGWLHFNNCYQEEMCVQTNSKKDLQLFLCKSNQVPHWTVQRCGGEWGEKHKTVSWQTRKLPSLGLVEQRRLLTKMKLKSVV